MVALLGLGALSSPGRATPQSQTDLLIHGSLVDYEASPVKRDGFVVGAYGTWGTGYRHLLEVGGAWTRLRFRNASDLDQVDAAAAYNFYSNRGSLRAGGHFIAATDDLTDGGLVLFGGGSLYDVGRWSLGAEGAWSTYPNYDGGLFATQIAPTGGLTLKSADLKYTFGVTARGYFIWLSEAAGQDSRDFASGELSASLASGRLTLSGYGWLGEQAFAVRQSGFAVFNLSELHKGGFGAGLRWVTSPESAVSAGYYVERFTDLGFSGTAIARTFSFAFGYTF
jgi:hypothetical protein